MASATEPRSLYRFYDRAGVLLYVGISCHLPVRLSQHRRNQPWWERVATIQVEHFPDEMTARLAEQTVMDRERPAFNRSRSVGQMIQRTLRIRPKTWEAAMQKAEEQQENLSDVIREAIERYVEG